MSNSLRTLYPEIESTQSGFLAVDTEHKIYWEESGNPKGKPILFLHGGPGVGCEPKHRRFFNPAAYRIVLLDQRGAGKSTPHASLHNNTTWHLIDDIEKVRVHLKIDRWVVFGGSWGSTLALAYAETHPDRVLGLILRGIFLCRPQELHWFYQFGAHHIFPDVWEKFLSPIPKEEQSDLVRAYYRRLTAIDPEERKRAAAAWAGWEAAALRLRFDPELFKDFTRESQADAIARIECHYFLNKAFFATDNWLLEQIAPLRRIPGFIIHGRYDIVCPLESAWELHKAWPEAHFEIIPDAGHSASEVGITDALIRATDALIR